MVFYPARRATRSAARAYSGTRPKAKRNTIWANPAILCGRSAIFYSRRPCGFHRQSRWFLTLVAPFPSNLTPTTHCWCRPGLPFQSGFQFLSAASLTASSRFCPKIVSAPFFATLAVWRPAVSRWLPSGAIWPRFPRPPYLRGERRSCLSRPCF